MTVIDTARLRFNTCTWEFPKDRPNSNLVVFCVDEINESLFQPVAGTLAAQGFVHTFDNSLLTSYTN